MKTNAKCIVNAKCRMQNAKLFLFLGDENKCKVHSAKCIVNAKCKVHNAKLFLCEGDEEMLINFAFSI